MRSCPEGQDTAHVYSSTEYTCSARTVHIYYLKSEYTVLCLEMQVTCYMHYVLLSICIVLMATSEDDLQTMAYHLNLIARK